jgi:hypothetical protein
MRRMIFVLGPATLVLVVVAVSVSAGMAARGRYVEPDPLRSVIDMAFTGEPCPLEPPDAGTLITNMDPEGCWYGTVEGDIDGTIAFWEMDARYRAGMVLWFSEIFTIVPDSGGYINGVERGIWYLKDFRFKTTGWVTSTSPEWEDLLGAKFHEKGVTSDPGLGLPVTADGTKMILSLPGAPGR